MAQYKRKRIKTGPHSWINITQHQNGTTTTRSVSNKAGNTTTNVSSRGVRKTQNNNGWVQRSFWSGKQKKAKKSTSKSSSASIWAYKPKKKFDSREFISKLERIDKKLDKSKANLDNLTPAELRLFLFVAFVVILIIQLLFR